MSEYDALIEKCDENESLRAELAKANAEIERLRSIVDSLPKTADGVPIIPGMTLWLVVYNALGQQVYEAVPDVVVEGEYVRTWFGAIRSDRCYSTREAAEAARDESQQCK